MNRRQPLLQLLVARALLAKPQQVQKEVEREAPAAYSAISAVAGGTLLHIAAKAVTKAMQTLSATAAGSLATNRLSA